MTVCGSCGREVTTTNACCYCSPGCESDELPTVTIFIGEPTPEQRLEVRVARLEYEVRKLKGARE